LYTDIIIDSIDERFTSSMAKKAILSSGVNKKRRRDKALVDQVSATIILQSYLQILSS
jgi:putative Holliday junction resolvase